MMVLYIGGSRGAPPAPPPPPPPQQDQFLSFLHTFLPKSVCVGGWCPHQRVGAPPNGKSWIRHWDIKTLHIFLKVIRTNHVLKLHVHYPCYAQKRSTLITFAATSSQYTAPSPTLSLMDSVNMCIDRVDALADVNVPLALCRQQITTNKALARDVLGL